MRVFTSTTEDARSFHTGVARLFKLAIEECKLVLSFNRLLGFLLDSFLFGRSCISLLPCPFNVLSDVLEVKLFQTRSTQIFREQSQERADEILHHSVFLREITSFDHDPLVADFFNFRTDLNRFTLEKEWFSVWFVSRVKSDTFVLETKPLDVWVCDPCLRLVNDQVVNIWCFEFNWGCGCCDWNWFAF